MSPGFRPASAQAQAQGFSPAAQSFQQRHHDLGAVHDPARPAAPPGTGSRPAGPPQAHHQLDAAPFARVLLGVVLVGLSALAVGVWHFERKDF